MGIKVRQAVLHAQEWLFGNNLGGTGHNGSALIDGEVGSTLRPPLNLRATARAETVFCLLVSGKLWLARSTVRTKLRPRGLGGVKIESSLVHDELSLGL